jgi:chromate reductase, NAD(P)H dehydrogenase (quinone)
MKVIAMAGSVRRTSYNRAMLAAAAELAPPRMKIQITDAVGALPLFNADLDLETNEQLESVRRLRGEIADADGLLIATPEYNHSLPGVLKNAIDWLSRPGPRDVLAAKPVAIIGATSGPWGTRLAQSALRQVLYSTEASVLPRPMLFVRDCATLFDSTGVLKDAPTRKRLIELIGAFEKWINQLSGQVSGMRSLAIAS